jgi:23S rRNA pseudouridine1911/1915/1917 synthase
VHLGALGLGIIGDPVYRPRRRPQAEPPLRHFLAGFGRIALHARRLGFEHPITGLRQSFERAAPASFNLLCEHLRAQIARLHLVNHTGGRIGA